MLRRTGPALTLALDGPVTARMIFGKFAFRRTVALSSSLAERDAPPIRFLLLVDRAADRLRGDSTTSCIPAHDAGAVRQHEPCPVLNRWITGLRRTAGLSPAHRNEFPDFLTPAGLSARTRSASYPDLPWLPLIFRMGAVVSRFSALTLAAPCGGQWQAS